jgi:hypothetical protein
MGMSCPEADIRLSPLLLRQINRYIGSADCRPLRGQGHRSRIRRASVSWRRSNPVIEMTESKQLGFRTAIDCDIFQLIGKLN